MASISNTIDPPPRLTGEPERDTVAVIQWLSAFYTKGVLAGGLLQSQNLGSQFTEDYPTLASLAALVATAGQLAYFTGEHSMEVTGLTDFARTILDDIDAASVRTTIGAGTVISVSGTAPITASGGDAAVIAISDFVASGAGHARGAVPDPGAAAGTTKFLREDATFAVPPGAGDVVGPAGVTANDLAQFDGATGKAIKGGLAISTSTTLAENSDTVIATQKAIKAYADGLLAANDAMVYKGATDCSANPNYPAANAGDTYRVSVAGKIGGAAGKAVEVGDWFVCNTDATASGNEAAVGANWNVIQANLDGVVIGPASATGGNVAVFNGATGKLLKDGGTLGTAAFTDATAYLAAAGTAANSSQLQGGTWASPAADIGSGTPVDGTFVTNHVTGVISQGASPASASGSAAEMMGEDAKGTWAIHKQNTQSVAAVATTIATSALGGHGVGIYHVYGATGGTRFFDTVCFNSYAGTVTAETSRSVNGAPAVRTYTASGTALQLAMASGTYNINVYGVEGNYPT